LNFLAHIYLSKGINDLMLGNFMADAVKGRKYLDYPRALSDGILLHRFIDDYTDNHPVVEVSKDLLRPHFGRYASPVSDIVYDHFLAVNFNEITGLILADFVQEVYHYMHENRKLLTPFSQEILPYMIKHNWLENYQYKDGLDKIFRQFGRRIGVGELFDSVTAVVWDDYQRFESNFKLFFPLLEEATDQKRTSLVSVNI
jgi:acyl carrier protein phosphodiesterase